MTMQSIFPEKRRERILGTAGCPRRTRERPASAGWLAVSAWITLFFLYASGLPVKAAGGEVLAVIQVDAGNFDRFDSPVSIDLSGLAFNEDRGLPVLFETMDGVRREVPCQLEPGMHPRLWWILSKTTDAGKNRSFELEYGDTLTAAASVVTALDDRGLTIRRMGRDVLRYNHAETQAPVGADSLFKRSGFIHPLWSPSGSVLTCIQPPDHVHHYGIWNPWTRTRFQGREVDFWNLGDGKGTVRFAGFLSRTEGPVFGGGKVRQEHVDLSIKGREIKALDELWDLRVWNSGASDEGFFLVDFTTTLSCAGADSLLLEAYRYGGGIGFRATPEWTRENIVLFTSEGKTRKDADGTPARWCAMSGPSAGGTGGRAGVLFMSHPSNRSHPEPMRVWPEDANNGRGDLFFEFCPIRHRPWNLAPGREYALRYRMLVHDGEISPADCERAWRDFAFPPKVTIR